MKLFQLRARKGGANLNEELAMRSHLPQLTKRKLCLSAAHMPWHSEQARNERSGDDDFIRGSKQEKYDWNAGQASSAGETRQEAGNRQVPPAGPQ